MARIKLLPKFALTYSLAVLTLISLSLWFVADYNSAGAQKSTAETANLGAGTSFPGTGTGNIPDGLSSNCAESPGSPLEVTFDVTGTVGAVSDVRLDTTLQHSWVGDLEVILEAPNADQSVIFSRTGATSDIDCGFSSSLTGNFNFFDGATGQNWWDEAFFNDIMNPGDYEATEAGGAGQTDPAPTTSLNTAFSGVTDANGTWKLRIRDYTQFDTGSISSATLILTTTGVGPKKPNVDFNGDGSSDYVILQDTSPMANLTAPMRARSFRERIERMKALKENGSTVDNAAAAVNNVAWWVSNSGGGAVTVGILGDYQTDFPTPADFDGDGMDDYAVWRTGGPDEAAFYIFESSTQTVRTELFGQALDDPGVVGDYDGDGKADPAVYRCPDSVAGQCYYYYRGSNNNPGGDITYIPWGYGTIANVFAAPGDFDGDGKYDFNIQTNSQLALSPEGSTQGIFYLLKSQDLGFEINYWGYYNDFIAPGDYDGDGKDDICVVRDNGGQLTWYVLQRDGGTQQADWGLNSDWVTPGDYDGDGKADFAVWRPGTGADDNYFYVYQSGTQSLGTFEWGSNADIPAANWNVH